MKKRLTLTLTWIIALTLLLSIGITYAYSVIYTKEKQVNEDIEIGNTVKTVDGLNVTLYSKEEGKLTYYALDESTTDKHTLTYVYDYTIVNGIYDIEISTLSNDIVIVGYEIGDRITIEFALNQDKEFTEGQVLNITFLFELVDVTLGDFSPSNPLNINDATQSELEAIGLTYVYGVRTISGAPYTSLEQWLTEIQATELIDELQRYADAGVLVFE